MTVNDVGYNFVNGENSACVSLFTVHIYILWSALIVIVHLFVSCVGYINLNRRKTNSHILNWFYNRSKHMEYKINWVACNHVAWACLMWLVLSFFSLSFSLHIVVAFSSFFSSSMSSYLFNSAFNECR